MNEQLGRIKLLLDIDDTSQDELLALVIRKCEMFVRCLCNIFEVDDSLELLPLSDELICAVEDLAVVKYNKLGSEGLKNETIGPLKMDYDDIPADVRVVIDKHKRMRF